MPQWNNVKPVLYRIGTTFSVCFGGAYFFSIVGIIVFYYCLPASDAAKTSLFPIILCDPFVLTIAFTIATLVASITFVIFLLYLFFLSLFRKILEK